MRRLRLVFLGLLTGLVFALAFGCAALALMAQGGRISDRLDVLAHFAPFWLVGAAVALTLSLVLPEGPARLMIRLCSLIGVLAAGGLIAPEFLRPMTPKAPIDAPNQFKLIQYNIWGRNRDLEADVAWITSQNPDAVVVEEASRGLRLALTAAGYHVTCRKCSVMIFSRETPISTEIVSPEDGPRAPMARATFLRPGGPVTVIGVHYTWPTDGWMQQAQGRRLARVLDQFPKDRLILAGDFNSTPWSFSRRREDRMFGLERRTRALFSWPADEVTRRRLHIPLPFLPIDHVYAGADFRTVSVARGPRLSSDHFPVVAVLALEGGSAQAAR